MTLLTVQIAGVMIKIYESNKEAFSNILITGSVHRQILLSVYNLLLKDNSIVPIEKLDEENKNKLRALVKEKLNGRAVAPELILDLYRSFHTLDLITQQ